MAVLSVKQRLLSDAVVSNESLYSASAVAMVAFFNSFLTGPSLEFLAVWMASNASQLHLG